MKTQFRTLIFKSPALVRDRIFTLLDPYTQLTVRKVCKSWRRLVDQVIPFRVILNEQTFSDVHKFVRTHKIGELAIGYFSQTFPDPGNAWRFAPSALTIILDEPSSNPVTKKGKKSENSFPKKIELLPEAKLEKIFQEFGNVQKITLDARALALIKGGDSSFMKQLDFPDLVCLNIFVEEVAGLAAIQGFLSLHCPKLTELSIAIKNDDDMSLYEDVYAFVGRNRSIKKLTRTVIPSSCPTTLHFDRNNNPEADSSFLNHLQADHKLGPVTYAEVLQGLGQVKLSNLDMQALTSEGRARKNFELQLIRAQTTLTTLHLGNIRAENMPVWRTVPAILRQCSSTLKSVILDGCFCSSKADRPGPFWCHWVEKCIHLERLEMLICGIKVVDVGVIPSKHLKILCLGHMLTQRQMRSICESFLHLEELSWPQLNTRADVFSKTHIENDVDSSRSRVVTVFQFRRACNLPKLVKLTLSSTSCKLRPVQRFAGPLMGVYENYLEVGKGATSKRGDLEYTFDRKIFSYHLTNMNKYTETKPRRSKSKAYKD